VRRRSGFLFSLVTVVMLGTQVPPVQAATAGKIRLAVCPLNTDREHSALADAATAVLTARLSQAKGATLIAGDALAAAMRELRLSVMAADEQTALKVGRVVSADSVLLGRLIVTNQKITLTARVVDLAAGEVSHAATVTGPVSQLLSLVEKLATKLAKQLAVPLPAATVPHRIQQTPDFEKAWLMGLSAYYAGDYDYAVGCFLRAKRFQPHNPTVRLLLVRAYVAQHSRDHAQVELHQLERLFPAAAETQQAKAVLKQ